jgi:polar amino acid transport system substrate-binding protein
VLQQGKVKDFVTDRMIRLRKSESVTLGVMNKTLTSLETSGEMNAIFNKRLGSKTP